MRDIMTPLQKYLPHYFGSNRKVFYGKPMLADFAAPGVANIEEVLDLFSVYSLVSS